MSERRSSTRRSNRAREQKLGKLRYRRRPVPADVRAVGRLVAAAGVFYMQERAIALELLRERLRLGRKSGYFFVFAEHDGDLVGYAAWGPIPLTKKSYDLYWIVVDRAYQGRGIGRALLRETEHDVASAGGGRLYIETSSRDDYERTRKFYTRAGYRQLARLQDFYAENDHKMIFGKRIDSSF